MDYRTVSDDKTATRRAITIETPTVGARARFTITKSDRFPVIEFLDDKGRVAAADRLTPATRATYGPTDIDNLHNWVKRWAGKH